MPMFLILLVVVLGVLAMMSHLSRGRTLLDRWAAREGLDIVDAQHCWMWRGPFWLRSGKNNAVYRVTVRDAAGAVRSGYVRCGGFFLGMWSDEVAVEWDR